MAINGKHTTGVMIFPRVHAALSVCAPFSRRTYTRVHALRRIQTPPLKRVRGEGERGVVSVYARAYHPIRSPALGLLNATSVQLPRTLGIYLSIHLLEARMEGEGQDEGWRTVAAEEDARYLGPLSIANYPTILPCERVYT